MRVRSPNFSTSVEAVWNHRANPEANSSEPAAPVRGHGLGSTM